jgi:hypothetical protein
LQSALDAKAATATTLTAGVGLSGGGDLSVNRTFTLDLSELAANQTLWDSASATRTLTAGLSGATDPVITFSDSLVDITTGTLKQGGTAVSLSGHAHAAADITSGTLAIAQGGTNLASGTSGGILYYSASGTLASSALLATSTVILGGGAGAAPTTGAGYTIVTAGSAGVGAVNQGTATSLARSDHDHRSIHTMTWYFPGVPATGVMPLTLVFPDDSSNWAILDMRVTANTTSASSSAVNIQRCTASCTGTSPTFSAIYSSDLSLSANTRTVAKGSAPNQNVSSLAAGDQFKVNLVTIGASLADITVTMTYKQNTEN